MTNILEGVLTQGTATVSYTHLDVYKRQVLTVDTLFAEKEVCVSFYNRKHLDYGEYQLGELSINGEVWKNQINSTSVVLHQAELEEKLIAGRKNQICIELVERKG